MKKLSLLNGVLLVLGLAGCATQKVTQLTPTSDNIAYMGRIGTAPDGAKELYWSGTSVKINFEGTEVKARLKDETGKSHYNVIIDGDSTYLLKPGTSLREYTLASNLSEGKHSVELFKRTEFPRGKTWFYGFDLPKGAKALPAENKQRKIVFYGNSISAGYAAEDYSGKDNPDSTFTNNYVGYAARTARHFNADYNCICKSGIGIMVSWFPYTMPEIYDRLDPNDAQSKWDFTKDDADVVVINLFQNDSWIVNQPQNEQFKRVFGTTAPNEQQIIQAYQQFVSTIRSKYPQAQIICMLGNMDITREGSPWPGYVQKAVAGLNDSKVYTHFEPYKNTPGHPRVEEQKKMADGLIQFIEKTIKW